MSEQNVFTSLFGPIDVLGVLQLSNGLAFLALLLAAILISMTMFKTSVDHGIKQLITKFLYIAVLFVAVSVIPTIASSLIGDRRQEVNLKIGSITTPEVIDPFQIHIIHGDVEHDIISGPYEAILTEPKNYLSLNPSRLVAKMNSKSNQITELSNRIEVLTNPDNSINFGG